MQLKRKFVLIFNDLKGELKSISYVCLKKMESIENHKRQSLRRNSKRTQIVKDCKTDSTQSYNSRTKLTSNKNSEIKQNVTFDDIEEKIFECIKNSTGRIKNKSDLRKSGKVVVTDLASKIAIPLNSTRRKKYEIDEINILKKVEKRKCSRLTDNQDELRANTETPKIVSKQVVNSKNDKNRPIKKQKANSCTSLSTLKDKNAKLIKPSQQQQPVSSKENTTSAKKKTENACITKIATKFSNNKKNSRRTKSCIGTTHKVDKHGFSTDSEVSDWENVDELSELLNDKPTSTKEENVQIEVKQESVLWGYKKRKKRTEQDMIEDYLRKQVNKSIREVYENMHKCHLLCLFAHGRYVNSVLASQSLLASSMSLIPKDYFSPKRFDLSHLEKFVKWFCKHIVVKDVDVKMEDGKIPLEDILSNRLSSKYVYSRKELVLLFILVARSIGMKARLIFSFYPISWKPSLDSLIKPQKEDGEGEPSLKAEEASTSYVDTIATKKAGKEKKYSRKMISSDSEVDNLKSKKKIKVKHRKKTESSDDDFELHNNSLKGSKKATNPSTKLLKKQRSINENNQVKKQKKDVLEEWAEVYVEEEEKWICVDVTKCKIHCVKDIEQRSHSNLAYVVAYQPDQTVKDVTKRYLSSWLSYGEKIRCDGKWWDEAVKHFLCEKTKKDEEEDKEIEENLRLQPLPKTMGEYKNHPLYALQRHLLKFEAIYPPNPSLVGFFKGEPVYPRECVKILSGREYWIRDAKVVIVGEKPYKVVKARPKWDKGLGQMTKDRPLELFGEWQVEDYDPPVAKNGKVPRNEYGNVELFKLSMLPKGCAYIQVAGLSRLAHKLDIDCAPALVGFDFHKGACHAVNDGFVVCEEFKDTLLDAWWQEQAEQIKRDKEKKFKRIYDNWKRLIRGMILKKRMKETYGNINTEEPEKFKDNCDEDKIQKSQKKLNSVKKAELKRKIENEGHSDATPTLITHPVVNLKIDLNSCISTLAKKNKRTNKKIPKVNTNIKEKAIESGKTNSNCKRSHDPTSFASSSEDSEDNMTASEKQEKIRKILEWNPSKGVGKSNPNLSDDSDNEASELQICQPSLKKTKKKRRKNCVSEDLQQSVSKELSDFNNEKYAGNSTKRFSLRSRGKDIKKTYKEGDAEASDISFDDSDDDKTFIPAKETRTESLMLSDVSD